MITITFLEVAKALGIHRTTVSRQVVSGAIPGGTRLYGKRWVVDRQVFENWLKTAKDRQKRQ